MQFVDEQIVTVEGKIVTKRYQLLQKVGQGAFSQCYKVRAVGSDQIYAMKIISKEKMKILEKEKLVEEIRIHQSLSHPNIVFLDHWFEDQFFQYIILEFCANKTLEQRCKNYDSTDEKVLRKYGIQIIQALKYLHSKRVLHRDLKLSNFFLNGNDQIKLGDFGFACRLQNQEELKREACGTPNFAAPQVIGGFGYSFPADVWSFGVILYRMKFGICPFEMPQLRQTLKKIKSADYSMPKWSSVSENLKDLIKKTIVIDYDERLTLNQVEHHPFFKNEEPPQRTGSLRNLINRLFSSDKNGKNENERMDSCQSKKDIKKILKDKTDETPRSARNPIILNNSLRDEVKKPRNKSPKSPTGQQTNKSKLGKLIRPPLPNSDKPRRSSPPQSQRFNIRTEPLKRDNSFQGNVTTRFNQSTRQYEITFKSRQVSSFNQQTKNLNQPTKTLNQPTNTLNEPTKPFNDQTKPYIQQKKPLKQQIVAQNQATTLGASIQAKLRHQQSSSKQQTTDPAPRSTGSNHLTRLTNKFKHHQSNSIMQHYASYLIYYVTVVNDHYLLHLTNGIRQILSPSNIYIVYQPGYILNQDGLRLVEPPKMIDYLSKEKLAESKFKLGEQSLKELLAKGEFVRRWRVLADRPVYTISNGAVVISTGKPQTWCLRTGQGDYLYNYKLEIVTDEVEMVKARVIYDQYTMRAKNTSGSGRSATGRSVSRQKKVLD